MNTSVLVIRSIECWKFFRACIVETKSLINRANKRNVSVGEDSDQENVEVGTNMEKEYDPYDHIACENSTSFSGTVLHLLALSLSPTILNIPSTFVRIGYVNGFIGSFLIIIFYLYCVRSIITTEYTLCKRLRVPNMTYTEVVYYAFQTGPSCFRWFAKYSRYIVDGNFVCTWIGANSVFVIIACKNIKCFFDYFFDVDMSIREVMIYISIPLVLLCCIPNLKYLIPCSIFANFINVSCIVIILCFVIQDLPSLENRTEYGDLSSIPLFVATILFTINVTGIIMPLKNEMHNPKSFNTQLGVLNVFYIPFNLLYSAFGLLCYVKYGDNVKESVIYNLPGRTWSKMIIGMYGIGICFFFPLNAYVPFDIIWNLILKSKCRISESSICNSYLVRAVVAFFTILLAFVVPNIALFLSFTGTVGTAIDSMILPATAEILISVNDRNKYCIFFKNFLIVLLGFVLIVIGMYDGISHIVAHAKQKH